MFWLFCLDVLLLVLWFCFFCFRFVVLCVGDVLSCVLFLVFDLCVCVFVLYVSLFCLSSFCGLGFVASRRIALCCVVFCALFFVFVVAGLGLVLGVAVVLFGVLISDCLLGVLDVYAPFVF